MLMADVAIWTALFTGLMIVLPAVWLLFASLWPAAVARAQERIPQRPFATFFTGAGIVGVIFLGVVLLGHAGLALPALLVSAAGIGWSFLGVAALARHAGTRLSSPGDPAWKPQLRGGIALALSFLVPFLGWILVFPIALILGAGAAAFALLRRAPAQAPASTPVPAPAAPQAPRQELLA